AISKSQALELSEVYKIASSQKINIIPLGIDINTLHDEKNILRNQFRNKYGITDNEIIIAIVGRIAPVKNPELFIQAAAIILKQKSTSVRFFIIGDGYLKNNIKDACDKLNLTWSEGADKNADVIFTSWIENIAPALNGIDILASTSNNEGTPMSIIEAQCCGKPVVATYVGGVPDIMLDEETGFLVEPNNAEAISEKFKMLIQNNALRNEMGLKAKAYALENFSKQKEVENYKQLYKSLLTLKKTERSALKQESVE
ncbi:MAG: glycosyltransferase family 4 protein, partial [Parafilimonas sp.]